MYLVWFGFDFINLEQKNQKIKLTGKKKTNSTKIKPIKKIQKKTQKNK